MNQRSKTSPWVNRLITLLLVAAIVKIIWVIVELSFLPTVGVEPEHSQAGKTLYRPYRLASNEALKRPVKPRPASPKRDLLRELRLIGLYQDSQRSIAVITKGNKSYLVTPGEKVLGYQLEEIEPYAAILSKNGKSYRLDLDRSKKKVSHSSALPEKKGKKPALSSEISDGTEEGTRTISRETLNKYVSDLDTIRKYIGLVPYKKDGALRGFKVRYIRKGSDFDKLGLRRGDIITGINGEQIIDLSVPMDLMRNLESLEGLTLQIKRGDKELELDYEVR